MFLNRHNAAPKRLLDQSVRRTQIPLEMQGVNADIPTSHLEPDVYSLVRNVEVDDVGMRSNLGHKAVFGVPLFPPEHLVFATKPNLFYWVYLSGSGIGVTDGNNQFDLSPVVPITSVWPNVDWTSTNINDFPVVNNAVDSIPLFWDLDTGVPMQPLPNWPIDAVAGSVRTFNKSLIAMNIRDPLGDFTNHLLWSNSALPGSIPDQWDPLPENDAGFATLSDTRGALIDGIQFRNTFMLFKQHSTYTMQYIGGNFVFAIQKLFSTSGILTTNSAAEYLGQVVALTDGDVIISDGQSAKSIIDKRMRGWLFRQMDADNYQVAFATAYHSTNQVWICFPEAGHDECTLALVWDATTNKYGIRDLFPSTPFVTRGQVGDVSGTVIWEGDFEEWDRDTTIWNEALFNTTHDSLLQADRVGSLLYAVNEGTSYNGTPILSKVERIGLDFGDITRNKFCSVIILRIAGNTGTRLRVRVGSSKDDRAIVNWNPYQDYVIGETDQGLAIQVFGRFIAFSVESEVDQPQWNLQGVEFYYSWDSRV